MRLEYQQNLRMEQRLVQSPQMIQAMQILQLTTPELLERIEAELEENPFLDLAEETEAEAAPGGGEAGASGESGAQAGEGTAGSEAEEAGESEELPSIGEVEQMFEGEPRPARSRRSEREGDFDPLQNLPAPDHASVDSILGELRVADATPEELDLAEFLLVSLDPRGFLAEGLQVLAEEAEVPVERLQEVLEMLRRVAHPALGARDIREAYLLQLATLPPSPQVEVARRLVQEHFDDLLANRLPHIAAAMEVPMAQVREAIEILGTLDSRPLADLEPDRNLPIVPDVIIEPAPDGEGYVVTLARDGLPELTLTEGAREALDKARSDKKLYEFLLKKIERARWFLDAMEQRRQTLRRIAEALARRQREFLDYGPERLRPLKMQEVADELGIHISTVSRAIRGKYAQTPQGILPLKGFFSGGQRTSSGGQRSRVSIQERIREIIEAEDKSNPYSDEEVVRILRERDGIKVARRTVTKYRLALGIPSSTLRRAY